MPQGRDPMLVEEAGEGPGVSRGVRWIFAFLMAPGGVDLQVAGLEVVALRWIFAFSDGGGAFSNGAGG